MDIQRAFIQVKRRRNNYALVSNCLGNIFEQCEDGSFNNSNLSKRIGKELFEDINSSKKVQTQIEITNLKLNLLNQNQNSIILELEQSKYLEQSLEIEQADSNLDISNDIINSEDINVLEVDEIDYLEIKSPMNKMKFKKKYPQKLSKGIKKTIK